MNLKKSIYDNPKSVVIEGFEGYYLLPKSWKLVNKDYKLPEGQVIAQIIGHKFIENKPIIRLLISSWEKKKLSELRLLEDRFKLNLTSSEIYIIIGKERDKYIICNERGKEIILSDSTEVFYNKRPIPID